MPVKDDMSLANALQYLIENAPKRAAMGEASRQLAESTFSMPLVVKAHLDIYETLTRTRTHAPDMAFTGAFNGSCPEYAC